MKPGLSVIAACITLPGIVALGATCVRAERERGRALASLDNLRALADGGQELASLRAAVPAWVREVEPAAGVTQSVTATLEKCGLRPNVLENLSADAEPDGSGSANPTVHRRGASLVLTNLTLPQLGSFLAAWREAQPRWTVTKIDLAPVQRKPSSPVGGDLPVRAVLGLEYLTVLPGIPGKNP